MQPGSNLGDVLRNGLARLADSARAQQMQAYMKSSMPFRGVLTPIRRRLVREVLADAGPLADRTAWEALAQELWDGASYREERYVAVDVCQHRFARLWQDAKAVPMYDHFVVSGAWWDHVDAVAIGLLGPILRRERTAVEPIVRSWLTDPDPWRRRTSIIIQVGAKESTDTALLADAIRASADDPDSFLRKGIGWALRDYARTDPSWVHAFVTSHASQLSPLSQREALRHIA